MLHMFRRWVIMLLSTIKASRGSQTPYHVQQAGSSQRPGRKGQPSTFSLNYKNAPEICWHYVITIFHIWVQLFAKSSRSQHYVGRLNAELGDVLKFAGCFLGAFDIAPFISSPLLPLPSECVGTLTQQQRNCHVVRQLLGPAMAMKLFTKVIAGPLELASGKRWQKTNWKDPPCYWW